MFSCDKVITIPQTSDICWFNAILMAIFYSQYSRKLLYHNFEGKKDKFSRIMNDIIKHNYIRTGQVIKYFEFMKPQNILKYINVDKTDLLKEFKTRKSYNIKNIETFLALFLNSLGKNILDIIIYNNYFYANYYSMLPIFIDNLSNTKSIDNWCGISDKDPEYIIAHKLISPANNLYKTLFLNDLFYKREIETKLNLKNYAIDIKGLIDLDDEIFYNGNKYILDSVLLYNYNSLDQNHLIAGITCKNNHYVYNGWIRAINNGDDISANIDNDVLPCELMKFDWNVKKDYKFCLNPNLCKLDPKLDTEDHCFSFNQHKYSIFIYVKDTSLLSSVDTNLSIVSSLTLPSLKANTSDFSELVFKNATHKIQYIKDRKERKKQQTIYKKEFKSVVLFTKFNSKFYLTIDEYLDKENLLLIKNPNKIIIDSLETDNLGIGHIDQLEYILNIDNYINITLVEDSSNNTLIYNGYKYILSTTSSNRNIYKLETNAKKRYLSPPIKLKPVCKKFLETSKQLLDFETATKPSVEYFQELDNFLTNTSDDIKINRSYCVVSGGSTNNRTTYIDCILTSFFNNKNSIIEELFFKKQLKNKNAIAIRNEFKSYYDTKSFNRDELLNTIQIYYNDFIIQNPEYPKIRWANGKYNFTDLIILLQMIFNFDKIKILLSYNEKFKIIEKKETTIKTIKITKISSTMLKTKLDKLALNTIIIRLSDDYKCFYKFNNKWYDNNNKLIGNITVTLNDYIKMQNYKIVSCVYY
jgi:hypothetical protein